MIIAAATTTTAFLSPLISTYPRSLLLLLKNPNVKPSFSPPPMASSVVAEYAKSNRSFCKTCSNAIPANALRLGVVTRDKQRGFDVTKWHHLGCFSFTPLSVASVESIGGFASLKSDDQEDLKTLLEERAKVRDTDDDVDGGERQKSPKKLKLSVSEDVKFDIDLAVSDVKDTYLQATLLPKWKAFHTVIFLEKDDGLQDSSKIAAFDFDGCLAKTSVKRIGKDAWSLMYPSIPDKLQKLYNDGFKLVIFTNESNIDRWKNKRQVAVDSKLGRLNNFIKHVKVPIQVFIACGYDKSGTEDPYRKPKTGMWRVMEKLFNSGIPIDMDHSFYVGDAAGRENDHSDADIKFAQGIGLKFYVPEEFFTV